MKLFLITVLILGLCVLGLAIKIWLKKDGQFSGTCASQSPFLNREHKSCSYCGKVVDENYVCEK